MKKLRYIIQLTSNMGLKYVLFRIYFEIKRKTGMLKRNFPTKQKYQEFISLKDWRENANPFFFESKEKIKFPKGKTVKLNDAAKHIFNGEIDFFSSKYYKINDWLINPDSSYKYDIRKHWTEIDDFSKEAGDIKFVWEKSRFSYLYTIMRYDYHFDQDSSGFVFSEIEDWMNANPINMGPNYKCSQEISLRLLNWVFTLYFYRNSKYLNNNLFQRIMHYIYWQLHHVYKNINFSRIAVRNNHAITETLTLYIISTLFPQFPNASKWRDKGKKWFEKEIKYQIYADGTYLQFSMNYHRVVVQLLTWAIKFSDIYKDRFIPEVYDRAYKSVNFLYQCQEDSNGYLPNYGANDGALFFKLSDNDYRDYRPQLDALHFILTGSHLYGSQYEDIKWYGTDNSHRYAPIIKHFGTMSFDLGGYYLIRESEALTFLRCGKHKDRPSQADNLHLDVWYKGDNILLDGGSYKYNTSQDTLKYFMGTESHNTVMIGTNDQMLKGSRFVWYDWSQAIGVSISENEEFFIFEGTISCFRFINKKITHKRVVKKLKGSAKWLIKDELFNNPKDFEIKQLWHINPTNEVLIQSSESSSETKSFYSPYYGYKEEINQIVVKTKRNIITTSLIIKE